MLFPCRIYGWFNFRLEDDAIGTFHFPVFASSRSYAVMDGGSTNVLNQSIVGPCLPLDCEWISQRLRNNLPPETWKVEPAQPAKVKIDLKWISYPVLNHFISISILIKVVEKDPKKKAVVMISRPMVIIIGRYAF